MKLKVPFVNLNAQYELIRDEINVAIAKVLESSAFSGGPFVTRFEEEFAEYCHSRFCVGVGSGTEALWLILLALGIGPGDEVITVPNTFIATVEAISFSGATPVFVDVDPRTYTMNPELVKAAITQKTKAVIPVHLFGQIADMDPIRSTCREHGLYVVEDACQAHGATYKGRRAGSLGDAAAFSFYPAKNLGAYGEAGAVTTDDSEIAHKIRILRDHGQSKKHYHEVVGWNARMDGLQAAILSVKLKYLDAWNESRRRWATVYDKKLGQVEAIVIPHQREGSKHVYHVYAVRVEGRDKTIAALQEKGIGCSVHYVFPVHEQKAYATMVGRFLPVAECCSRSYLSLPMYAELQAEQVSFVCDALTNECSGSPPGTRT